MAITATVTDDFGTKQNLYFRAYSSGWDKNTNTTRVDFHGYLSKAVADAAGVDDYRVNLKGYLLSVTPDGKTLDIVLAYNALKALLAEQGVTDVVDDQDNSVAS